MGNSTHRQVRTAPQHPLLRYHQSYSLPQPWRLDQVNTYYDEDGDLQGTSIHWFRDGLRVTQIDIQLIFPILGFQDQSLRVEVTPNDGNEFGDTVSRSISLEILHRLETCQ